MPVRKSVFHTAQLLLFIISYVGFALGKPNLTRSWVRNAIESDPATAVVGPKSKLSTSSAQESGSISNLDDSAIEKTIYVTQSPTMLSQVPGSPTMTLIKR